MGWKDVGWFARMLELLVGCGAGKLVGLVGFWVIWWVGGMLYKLVRCWWDVGWARGMCGFVEGFCVG